MNDAFIKDSLGTDRWIYIAKGQNTWGKGFTPEGALAAMKAAGGSKQWVLLAVVDPWAVITDMGDIQYTPRPKPPFQLEYIVVDEKKPKKRT